MPTLGLPNHGLVNSRLVDWTSHGLDDMWTYKLVDQSYILQTGQLADNTTISRLVVVVDSNRRAAVYLETHCNIVSKRAFSSYF